MTQAYAAGDAPRLQTLARGALEHWGLPESANVQLINLSENATFLITPPEGEPAILRVGRPEYSSVREVESELDWIQALARDGVARTARVLHTVDASTVIEAATEELPQPRPCVMFSKVAGSTPDQDQDLAPLFRTLGGVAAQLHAHARAWRPPLGFVRRRWGYDTTVGDRAHWGSWRDGVGVGPFERRLLERLTRTLAMRLAAYGTDPRRFGLVHADLRLANVLFDGDDPFVIDFDDCGWSWFMFDLAGCTTFIEDRPDLPELVGAWLAGYGEISPVDREAEAIIPSMIMLRRLQVLAWIGSHAETELAREEGIAYTHASCALAERYLAGDGPGI